MKKKLLVVLLAITAVFCLAFGLTACSTSGTDGLEYTLSDDGGYYICDGLGTATQTDIKIASKYNGKPVTEIGKKAFYDCKEITSVKMPDSVTYIGEKAFSGCNKIESVKFSSNLEEIGNSAFEKCTELKSIELPKKVTSLGSSAFEKCASLESVKLSKGLTFINFNAFSNTKIREITIPDEVTCIGGHAFENCKYLQKVTFGKSINEIWTQAFNCCYSLKDIDLSGITMIDNYAFMYCSSLTTLTLPESLTKINIGAFQYCNKLIEIYNKSSLNIELGTEENGYVGYYAFNVYTPNSGESQIKTVDGYLFYDVGEKVYLIGYSGNKKALTLPKNFNGRDYEIINFAFGYNTEITEVIIPDSVTAIGNNAFRECRSLENVEIGKNVTDIGNAAFKSCGAKSFKMSNNITSFGEMSFENCFNLEEIYYDGTCDQWNAIEKGEGWRYETYGYTVYCTDGEIVRPDKR